MGLYNVVEEKIACLQHRYLDRLRIVLLCLLGLSVFIAETTIAYLTNCITLSADAFHVLVEAGVLVIGFLSKRQPTKLDDAQKSNTFGWARLELVGVTINGIFLMGVCFNLSVHCIQRIVSSDFHHIHMPNRILQVAVFGLSIRLIGFLLFCEKGEHFKGRSIVLHMLCGFTSSIGSVVVGAVMLHYADETNEKTHFLDPIMGCVVIAIMVVAEVVLVKEAAFILLQKVPDHLVVDKLKSKFLKIPGVSAVMDMHIWQLTGSRILVSAHVKFENWLQYMDVQKSIKTFFHDEGIHSTTIQPVFESVENDEEEECISNCEVTDPMLTSCEATTPSVCVRERVAHSIFPCELCTSKQRTLSLSSN